MPLRTNFKKLMNGWDEKKPTSTATTTTNGSNGSYNHCRATHPIDNNNNNNNGQPMSLSAATQQQQQQQMQQLQKFPVTSPIAHSVDAGVPVALLKPSCSCRSLGLPDFEEKTAVISVGCFDVRVSMFFCSLLYISSPPTRTQHHHSSLTHH